MPLSSAPMEVRIVKDHGKYTFEIGSIGSGEFVPVARSVWPYDTYAAAKQAVYDCYDVQLIRDELDSAWRPAIRSIEDRPPPELRWTQAGQP